jgi:aspartate/methionine/tyrosine aminotransferase
MSESHRMQSVQSPVIPLLGDMIRRHPSTISLGQGVVHYGPPPEAIEEVGRFLADPENHKYRPVQGLPELVSAVAAKLRAENRLCLEGEDGILVTAGGNMAFLNALLAIADPGDEIILQSPCYFNHEMAVTMASCRPILVPTDADYQLQPEALTAAITPRTRAIVTISPNNPTGAVYPEETLRVVNALCAWHGLYHIHDEAYEYFTYGGANHFSPGSVSGSEAHTISLFSLSKAYGFASWRIGYMAAPQPLIAAIKKVQDTNLICAPVISQYAALGALRAGAAYCRTYLADLAEVRTLGLQELACISDFCTVPRAEGAFYFLLRLDTNWDAMELASRLIERHRVAVVPGTAFGLTDTCALRVSYGALQKETVVEGIGRLAAGLKELVKG